MTPLQLFLTQVGMSLGVSTVVVMLWTKPLRTLLIDICETNARATFWVTYSNIMLYMAPLVTIMLFGHSMMAGAVEIFFYKKRVRLHIVRAVLRTCRYWISNFQVHTQGNRALYKL